jgi:hypothetical protein
VAAATTAVVVLAAAILSWDALSWAARQSGASDRTIDRPGGGRHRRQGGLSG